MRTIRSEFGRDLLSGDLVETSSVFYICVSKVEVVNHVVTYMISWIHGVERRP